MSFFALKTLALLSMLWDHACDVWPLAMYLGDLLFPDPLGTSAASLVFQRASAYLGRIAAPVFLFSVANGYRHTRDRRKYALRLLVFACLAEGPYRLLFGMSGNILFTLLAGLLTLTLFEEGNRKRRGLGWALAVLVILLADWLSLTEGGGVYLLFILAFHLTWDWPRGKRALLWPFLLLLGHRGLTGWLIEAARAGEVSCRLVHLWALNVLGPYLGVIATLFYNGKPGARFPGSKYIWYVAYPAHLAILAAAAAL